MKEGGIIELPQKKLPSKRPVLLGLKKQKRTVSTWGCNVPDRPHPELSQVLNIPYGTRSWNGSSKSRSLNVPDKIQQSENCNSRVHSQSIDKKQQCEDQVSLQGPKLFFCSVGDGHNGQPKATVDYHGLSDGSTIFYGVGNLQNEEQTYWLEGANGYDKTIEFGPEILSSISCASKIFYQKPIKPESLKL